MRLDDFWYVVGVGCVVPFGQRTTQIPTSPQINSTMMFDESIGLTKQFLIDRLLQNLAVRYAKRITHPTSESSLGKYL